MEPVLEAIKTLCALLVAGISYGSAWLCHPAVGILQLQGALIGLLLASAWGLTGLRRQRELRRLQAQRLQCLAKHGMVNARQHAAATSGVDATDGAVAADDCHVQMDSASGMPMVSVVLPVTGSRHASHQSWMSALSLAYAGPLEFLFMVGSKADPAHEQALQLARRHQVANNAGSSIQVLVAGAAVSCSQKLHNIQAGIAAACPAAAYVLCVDDDVQLHPGFLQRTVERLQADRSYFMATGYPFDVPQPGCGLLTYAVLAYHLPLLVGFSLRSRIRFVWGGCMLLPLAPLRDDRYGIRQAWANGGYSDDLILAGKCGEHELDVLCPPDAIFPQRLPGVSSLQQYWNYLRRQLFVMDTYNGPADCRTNHTMAAVHSYLSLAFALPAVSGSLRLALWAAELLLLPSQQVYGGPGTSWDWLRLFGGRGCTLSVLSSLLVWASFAGAAASLRWMTGVVLRLFQELAPDSSADLDLACFNWPKLWLGLWLNNAVLPACMLYTFCQPAVTWSGLRYHKRRGRVRRLDPA